MPLVLRRVQYNTLTELDTLLDGVFEDGLPLDFTSLYSLHPEQKLTVAHYQKLFNIEADIGKALFMALLGATFAEADKIYYEEDENTTRL